MSINRAAMAATLQHQCQQALATSATNNALNSLFAANSLSFSPISVQLLQQAGEVNASSPLHVALSFNAEHVLPVTNSNTALIAATAANERVLQCRITTQFGALPANAALHMLDIIAEQIEQALSDDDSAKPWLAAQLLHTDFDFKSGADGLIHGSMAQHFRLNYVLHREEVCTAVPVKAVYLSKHGGPHELVATLPTD